MSAGARSRCVAALYDIHGNLPALEAVLTEVRGLEVDLLLVGGDVMPGPMAAECLELLSACDVPVQYIMGNGEREVLSRIAGETSSNLPIEVQQAIDYSARQLTEEHRNFIGAWPATLSKHINAMGSVLFCHATPRSDIDIFTKETPESVLLGAFSEVKEVTVVCGHTHMQFDRQFGAVRVLNAGSVGMPFGSPGAYWLLLREDVEFRRTAYDPDAATQRIRRSPYPGSEEFARTSILNPPSETEMLAAFAHLDLREKRRN